MGGVTEWEGSWGAEASRCGAGLRGCAGSPSPGQPSAAADAADADAPIGADDVGHGVPAGPRAPVGEVHRTRSHVRRELLDGRKERVAVIKRCFLYFSVFSFPQA